MTTKKHLENVHALDKRINSKLDQIEGLRSLLERATTVLTGMPKGNSQKDPTNIIARIWRLEAEVTEDIDLFVDIVQDVRKAIEQLDDDTERYIIESKYIAYWSWSRIIKEIGMPDRTVYQVHGRALTKLNLTLQ